MENVNEIAIDARPALPVSSDSLWDQAAIERDNIATKLETFLKEQNISPWIRKSKPGEYPLYVVVESWIQNEESNLSASLARSFLKIIILVEPCRIHNFIYKVEMENHERKFNGEHWELVDEELRELAIFMIKGGRKLKPKFFKSRLSNFEKVFSLFLSSPFENKLIPEAKPNFPFFSINSIHWMIGLVLVLISVFTAQALILLIGIFLIFKDVFPWLEIETIDVVPKQSLRTPRREFRIDSWHVSIPNAGEQFDQFRQRIYGVIKTKEPSIDMGFEIHQRLTPRGYEERERLVLTKGQTTLHVHVYPFANDAFVGWESYLNWNRWEESKPISTTERNGKKYNYRSLNVGIYNPTDFDIIEADVLAETTHRIIVDEIKAFLKEKEIEADLDFKIIRGDRANALKEGKDEKK